MRQNPTECLFQFVCSSNNHISRIHGMVERLCSKYGSPLKGVSLSHETGMSLDPVSCLYLLKSPYLLLYPVELSACLCKLMAAVCGKNQIKMSLHHLKQISK